jgi:hypothetical protein
MDLLHVELVSSANGKEVKGETNPTQPSTPGTLFGLLQ